MSDSNTPISDLPRPHEILQSAVTETSEASRQQRNFEQRFSNQSVNAQAEYTHLKGLRDHYFHKKGWSWFLMGLMALMMAFQSFLLVQVGFGYFNFTEYAWLLPALLVQNLGQVIALAYVVVKSLFR